MCTLTSRHIEWKLQAPMEMLLTLIQRLSSSCESLTAELLFPGDRYSSVRTYYTLPQSLSHTPHFTRSGTREHQTQEYNTINITCMLRPLYGPAALD